MGVGDRGMDGDCCVGGGGLWWWVVVGDDVVFCSVVGVGDVVMLKSRSGSCFDGSGEWWLWWWWLG